MFEVPRESIEALLHPTAKVPSWKAALAAVRPESPLGLDETASLIHSCRSNRDAFEATVAEADSLKREVHGSAVKLFVPVYISNVCENDCLYCGYRRGNRDMPRRTLNEDEFEREIREVTRMGYRVLELVTSECPSLKRSGRLARYIEIARKVVDSRAEEEGTLPDDEAPEVLLMSWPLSLAEFESVGEAGLDAFYLWQETYDEDRYASLHPSGTPKAGFRRRLEVFDRAINSGIRRVGMGVLFGLSDWRFDILALIAHGRHLEGTYGIRIDALGLPRFKPAQGAPLQSAPVPVSDEELRLAVALYRLAFPQSHVFLNTREKLSLMLRLLEGGGSEMNIACAVFPGGYTKPARERQFEHYSYPTEKTLSLLQEKGYHPTHFAIRESAVK